MPWNTDLGRPHCRLNKQGLELYRGTWTDDQGDHGQKNWQGLPAQAESFVLGLPGKCVCSCVQMLNFPLVICGQTVLGANPSLKAELY